MTRHFDPNHSEMESTRAEKQEEDQRQADLLDDTLEIAFDSQPNEAESTEDDRRELLSMLDYDMVSAMHYISFVLQLIRATDESRRNR